MKKIAIIGAGLSGLTAATVLKDHADITLFEKSRGVSGRIATRWADPYFFDHGAQFFKADSEEFKNFISPMISEGIIDLWHGRFVEFEHQKIINRRQWNDQPAHYVGVPGMNAIGKYLSQGLNIKLEVRIKSITKKNDQWTLQDEHGNTLGNYDWVLLAIPAEQASELLPHSVSFYKQVSTTKMQACFSLMLGFETRLPLEFDAALVGGEDISWISVNNSKPGRTQSFSLLVHSSNRWANQHIDDNRDDVLQYLCHKTSEIIRHDLNKADHKAIHGWRFANIAKQNGPHYLLDSQEKIGACGDWLIQGRVESAFTSGFEISHAMIKNEYCMV